MRKGIILGIGILISLLALAGTGSAKWEYNASCGICHTGFPTPLKSTGILFNDTHKFDGISKPDFGTSCSNCHIDPHNQTAPPNFGMTRQGQNYSIIHNGINTSGYARTGVNCTYCHVNPNGGDFSLRSTGTTMERIHKFDGVSIPNNATGCTVCHTDVMEFLPLISNGSTYNSTHRYNSSVLASELLFSPGCSNCHVNAIMGNFTLLSGTPSYLTSFVCKDCHRAKYDNWTNTMHRVVLTVNTSAAAMNLTLPNRLNWSRNVSYVVIGKTNFQYMNESGYYNRTYYVVNGTNVSNSGLYTSGARHTTGYNATRGNQSNMPGIVGSWNESGVGCERCHQPAGNGHQVVVNYSGLLCEQCHETGWESSGHSTVSSRHATDSCSLCHGSTSNYTNVSADSSGVSCAVCHNPHNTTDDQYGQLFAPGGFNATVMASVKDEKLSFFNSTASKAASTDIYDSLIQTLLFPGLDFTRKYETYGSAAINVTGRPASEVLCSMCHYKHGLGPRYTANVSFTHGRNSTSNQSKWATCTDCHFAGAGGMKNHSLDIESATSYPTSTCSRGTECHVTSEQNQSLSNDSLVPVIREWEESLHNDKVNGQFYNNSTNYQNSSCSKCHSPFNWNPANQSDVVAAADFKGITCAVCHNLHDMGDWITNNGKAYAWFNRDAFVSGTTYIRNYSVMANTTELCGNCHSNIRIGREGPGWASSTSTTPISPHGFPAKDVFVGSWKQSSLLNFECIDCHMYINKTSGTGGILNDSGKITGHSFAMNETGLQNTTKCSGCHDGTNFGTIAGVIEEIKADTHTKWNSTNTTVLNALDYIKRYTGEKNLSRDQIAQAYWKLKMVSSDGSWGVHDPVGTKKLLEEASTLAIAANASLGRGNTTEQLYTGWNVKSLNETPSVTAPVSVMSSVIGNISVVWGLNASTQTWLLYDPAGPTALNTLTSMVKGESYEIKAINNCTWVV
ncbi:MAG: ammonia-forming cytochrome c nitrite reductase subunit c552 [Candidatus Methanoperedens sp.]|nr:ammonia-forming cytochrome c nitrite reductase subunit c552 [Candidatus Methanoperedens sp.]MCE8427187.1 ammonia-forming cytochrome c nitrite reductase subunit c552 [Candidatus Methanoperedens sp.]